MKKEKKEKKGIGCATVLILLPIPGAIIYGLASETEDLAHSFIYGCFISLVFLILSVISAAKEKKERRRAEKTEKNRAANAAKYGGVQPSAAAARQSVAPVRTGSGGTITEAPQKRSCPACGAALGENAKFCTECGAPVPKKKEAPKKRFCAECGAELRADAKFCENCGTAAASAAGVTIPVTGRVNSVTVSDQPPQRSGAPTSGTKGATTELKQTAKKVAALLEQTLMAPDTPGEITFPVNTAQKGVLLDVLAAFRERK